MTDEHTLVEQLKKEAKLDESENGFSYGLLRKAAAALRTLVEERDQLKARLHKEPWCQQCGVVVRECPRCHQLLKGPAERPPAPIQDSRTANVNHGEWQRGIAGHANIVSFDGDDVRPIAYVPDERQADTIIKEVSRLQHDLAAARTDGKQLAKWLAETDTRAKRVEQQLTTAGEQIYILEGAKLDKTELQQQLASAREKSRRHEDEVASLFVKLRAP